ncbi:MAG: spore cortex-lytic enzyme [Clostridia bacterium]|jgi:N-acetylmuramoyl-L-alanine amidase|nr:spore cortex-lytic enzyme [Clostridia bacterium]MDD3862661.1 spore cortex-lytic enzyme [Clostridia bacterium]MDD4408383.1 spore cortex-lytic enzyme [Clostridia bacterium]
MKRNKILAASMVFVLLIGALSALTYHVVNTENLNNEIVQTATVSENKAIQKKLKDLGYYYAGIDGIIGPKSKISIRNFQRDYGLVVDGIVGPQTLKALGITTGNYQSSSDLYLLAKCVYAEARGEPYVGQVAVAAVILNRVKSPDFPNTLSGVIYQPWAFTAVNDGQIKLEPDNTAYQAAQDALNGWDPTYGCLYYYNPAKATSKWIFSRKTVTTIGKHVFAI